MTIDISGYKIRKDFHSTIMNIKRYRRKSEDKSIKGSEEV
ncbi:hypothetical protein MITSMUL_04424 [Mitsuokella multacida DSM 20544]|uniref:Uncharacterized protein n=1 Tax=Mitsuokella multacida DSM 20544 TaxID=500635 RepID=C9KMI8_9FIRM|nr:hypothetical protein MITSMUL_04424 [Mitsuokella multacida DSM 20544]